MPDRSDMIGARLSHIDAVVFAATKLQGQPVKFREQGSLGMAMLAVLAATFALALLIRTASINAAQPGETQAYSGVHVESAGAGS